MSTVVIRPGAVVRKDPTDTKVYTVDWDTENLAAGVIIQTSSWTITEQRPVPAWSATATYARGARVVSAGTIYGSLASNTNQLPPNATYWVVVGSATALTKDSESILVATNRTTQVRLSGGTLGQVYDIANRIVTNETPAQTKEISFSVLIENQ